VARRHFGEDAEPAERVDALEAALQRGGDCRARGAVEAVAPRDEVRIEPFALPPRENGASLSIPWIATSAASDTIGSPRAGAAAIRSRVTSAWP